MRFKGVTSRASSGDRTPVCSSSTSAIKLLASASGPAKVERSVGFFKANESSNSLEEPNTASAAGYRLPQWLAVFLSKLRQEASRRRIIDASCYQKPLLASDWMIQCIWATMFRWVCSSRRSLPWLSDRLELLERQTSQQLPAQSSHATASCRTNSDYRYNLLNIIRGKGGCMTSQFRVGRRLDRIETRRRELLAIVPYHGSNNHHHNIETHPEEQISQEIWETAYMVGWCAWQHHYQSSQHQECDSENTQSDKCARLNNNLTALYPQEIDQENENGRIVFIQAQPTEDLKREPTQESAKCGGEMKQSNRKNKTHQDHASCDSEIPFKRVKTDLNNVLLE